MLITARSYTITQRLHSSEFTLVDKVVHSTDLYRKQDPLPQEREGSGELRTQALFRRTVQCGPIMQQYFVT